MWDVTFHTSRKGPNLKNKEIFKILGILKNFLKPNLVQRQSRLKSYPIRLIRLRSLDNETNGYKKSTESRDGIHETHSWMQFIGPWTKWRYFGI